MLIQRNSPGRIGKGWKERKRWAEIKAKKWNWTIFSIESKKKWSKNENQIKLNGLDLNKKKEREFVQNESSNNFLDQFFCSTLLFLGVFYRLSLALGRNNPFIPWYNLCIQTIRIIFYSSFYVERFLLKLVFSVRPIPPNIHISEEKNYRAKCRRRTKGRPGGCAWNGWKEGDLQRFAKIYVSGWGIDILLSASRFLPAPSALWLLLRRRLRVV